MERPTGAASGDDAVEVLVLGHLQVRRGGVELHAGGPRQRAVLALLAFNCNEVVTAAELAEAIWQDAAVERSMGTLQVYVSNLRGVLGDRSAIVAVGRGYRLDGELVRVDAHDLEQMVPRGCRIDLEPDRAAAILVRATSLWRGQPVAELDEFEALEPHRRRLELLRLEGLEHLFEAQLEIGQHHQVVVPLQELTAEHPWRERFWEQLITALYRCGRQAEALQAYAQIRVLLTEEMGLDPGHDLKDLERAVLAQSRSLDPPESPTSSGPCLLWVDDQRQLRRTALEPADSPLVVGRDQSAAIRIGTDGQVSRVHAELHHRDGAWEVVDQSLNGTRVNGVLVQSSPLHDGDIIQIGSRALVVRESPDAGHAPQDPWTATVLADSTEPGPKP